MMKLLKVIGFICIGLSIILGAWMFISWVDIIADNTTADPSYFSWNFFIIMKNIIG